MTKVTGDLISNLPGDRQDDTTNTSPKNTRLVYGWGFAVPGAANSFTKAITLPVTFAQRPIIIITFGGDATSATTYGSGSNTIKDTMVMKAYDITTSSFNVRGVTRDGTAYSAGNAVFFQWIAIGEV